jgi:hypothetical protein
MSVDELTIVAGHSINNVANFVFDVSSYFLDPAADAVGGPLFLQMLVICQVANSNLAAALGIINGAFNSVSGAVAHLDSISTRRS